MVQKGYYVIFIFEGFYFYYDQFFISLFLIYRNYMFLQLRLCFDESEVRGDIFFIMRFKIQDRKVVVFFIRVSFC